MLIEFGNITEKTEFFNIIEFHLGSVTELC